MNHMNTQPLHTITLPDNHSLLQSIQADYQAKLNAHEAALKAHVQENLQNLTFKTELIMCACLYSDAVCAYHHASQAQELAYQALVQHNNNNSSGATNDLNLYSYKARVNDRLAAVQAFVARPSFGVSASEFVSMLNGGENNLYIAGFYEESFSGSSLVELASSIATATQTLSQEFAQEKTYEYALTMVRAHQSASVCAEFAQACVQGVLECSPSHLSLSPLHPFAMSIFSVPYMISNYMTDAVQVTSYRALLNQAQMFCDELHTAIKNIDTTQAIKAYKSLSHDKLLGALKTALSSLAMYHTQATSKIVRLVRESLEAIQLDDHALFHTFLLIDQVLSLSLLESMLRITKDKVGLKRLSTSLDTLQSLEEAKSILQSCNALSAISRFSDISQDNVSDDVKNTLEVLIFIAQGFLSLQGNYNDITDQSSLELVSTQKVQAFLCEVDYKAIKLERYDDNLLLNVNAGHWDLWEMQQNQANENQKGFCLKLDPPFYARPPLMDVKDRVVAIDFGTKSTMVGYLDDYSSKRLLRIGTKDLKSEGSDKDYENPTAMEFVDVMSFINAYKAASRPFTSYDDVKISYEALDRFFEASNEDFYRFFMRLKQWAGIVNKTIRLKDTKHSFELPPFLSINNQDINPIEIYAYYIGRYINHMRNGIYLDYLLSFPVKYPKEVREKIRLSFEQGIKKSIPKSVLEQKSLQVTLAASEPAAYAISALKEYGFYTETYHNKRTYYGVFDFGGGTTDFDFGIWQGSQDSRYDFELKHFAEGGDIHLGGENLLELLSFEVFKANASEMRNKNCSFTKPSYVSGFGGDEMLIKDTQEAMKNTAVLAKELRMLWENVEAFRDDSIENEDFQSLKSGTLALTLVDNLGQNVAVNVSFDPLKLIEILKDRINQGVQSFYHAFKLAADRMDGLDILHIFLAGNSSRSILVKEAFEKMIDEASQKSDETLQFVLYPALGTKEADQKRSSLGLEVQESKDLSCHITGKSGVVFGLLDSRSASRIRIISEVALEDEAKFGFYLGQNRFDCFKIVIDKSQIKIGGDWQEFLSYGDIKEFELFYTSNAIATTNKLRITETKRLSCVLPQAYAPSDRICIKAHCVDTISYAVFSEGEMVFESDKVILK